MIPFEYKTKCMQVNVKEVEEKNKKKILRGKTTNYPDVCHQRNVLHCWKPILPKYQTNFIGHFLQKMA